VVLEGVELIELGDSIEVVMVDEDAIELGLGVEDALEVTTFKEEVDKVFEDAITVVVVPAGTPFDVEVNVDPVLVVVVGAGAVLVVEVDDAAVTRLAVEVNVDPVLAVDVGAGAVLGVVVTVEPSLRVVEVVPVLVAVGPVPRVVVAVDTKGVVDPNSGSRPQDKVLFTITNGL
jgi:hypothetical protein